MRNKITTLLDKTASTFAKITYTTKVKTAAANKAYDVKKHTVANVQLFANVNAATEVFANAVKKSAKKLGQGDVTFESSGNYFHHTDIYSIVKHNIQDKFYLWCFYNSVSSVVYTIDGMAATKEAVATLLTPAEREKLLTPSADVTHNKTYDVSHDVVIRTIGLDNITSIKTQGVIITP